MLQALLEHANMVTNTTLLIYSEQAIQSDYALGTPQASPNGNTMLLIYLGYQNKVCSRDSSYIPKW